MGAHQSTSPKKNRIPRSLTAAAAVFRRTTSSHTNISDLVKCSSTQSTPAKKPTKPDSDSRARSSSARLSSVAVLAAEEIRQLRFQWELAKKKGREEPARSILQKTFQMCPEVEQIFRNALPGGATADSEGEENSSKASVHNQSAYREHAKALNAIIDMVLKNIENVDDIQPSLRAMGRNYVVIGQKKGFQQSYWDAFAEAMAEKAFASPSGSAARGKRSSLVTKAWGKVVIYMIDEIQSGYREAYRAIYGNSNTQNAKAAESDDIEAAPAVRSKPSITHSVTWDGMAERKPSVNVSLKEA